MGLLLAVVAPLAGIQDRVGAKALLIRLFMYFWCLKISQLGKQYKDYEISVASAEAFVKIACIRHMQASGMALRTVFKRQTSHCGSYPRLALRRGIEKLRQAIVRTYQALRTYFEPKAKPAVRCRYTEPTFALGVGGRLGRARNSVSRDMDFAPLGSCKMLNTASSSWRRAGRCGETANARSASASSPCISHSRYQLRRRSCAGL